MHKTSLSAAASSDIKRLPSASPPSILPYSVESCSSFASPFYPKNILINKPDDASSRWCADGALSLPSSSSFGSSPPYHITLCLSTVSIITSITFGKYKKASPANLKEFKLYAGLELDQLTEVLHSGLHNDDVPESFVIKHTVGSAVPLPSKYVRIVPISTFGPAFLPSIWYVELHGYPDTVDSLYTSQYEQYKEKEALRLCLKHLRSNNLWDPFHLLQQQSGCLLEHPLLTKLYTSLVLNGDYNSAEQILEEAHSLSLFSEYHSEIPYTTKWTRIAPDAQPPSAAIAGAEAAIVADDRTKPGMRGGHQLVMDEVNGRIYLLGGWDGKRELADFWRYSIAENTWTCISINTSAADVNGPPPCSCHKMCFDPKFQRIYVFGRYMDRPETTSADFYMYNIASNTWTRISDDTHKEGGPELLYDHQMVIDSERQMIYVFGGRIISSSGAAPSPSDASYSGLYSYNITTNQWKLLRSDISSPPSSASSPMTMKSRFGHNMLLDPRNQLIYIFSGQRHKEYLSDFFVYDIVHDTVREISRDTSKNGGIGAGFTQRSTIDVEKQEIYVMSGLAKETTIVPERGGGGSASDQIKNSFWVYDIQQDKWTRVYCNEHTTVEYWTKMYMKEPIPRFAHHLVYDSRYKLHYLFGGNAGELGRADMRLDDFWSLSLTKNGTDSVLKRCKFALRRARFLELCGSTNGHAAVEALKYLQTRVMEVVDHDNSAQELEFRSLASVLFSGAGSAAGSSRKRKPAPASEPHKMDVDGSGNGRVLTIIGSSEEESEEPIQQQKAPLAVDAETLRARNKVFEELLVFFPAAATQPKQSLYDILH